MSIQELLTYVEELSFKTSMIGYDKDEVDIQLDKICDEIEAIVREKDDEIAALRSGQPQAPVVVDLNQMEEAVPPVERTVEVFGKRRDVTEEKAGDDQAATEENAAQIISLQEEIRKLTSQRTALEEELSASKRQYKQLQDEKEAVQRRLAMVEEELDEADARAAQAERYAQTAQEKIESLEDREPQNKDEAYHLYMKNADLLCKQLAAVDAQKEDTLAKAREEASAIVEEAKAQQDKILEEAKSEGDRILEEANSEQERIVEEAKNQADQIAKQAEEKRSKAQGELEQIIEEGRIRKQQDEEDYLKLLEKKDNLVSFMKGIREDITALITKADNQA